MMNEREVYQEVGMRVRRARLERKMTQDELSEKIQISRASMSNMEVGRHRIQLHVLYQLANVLDHDIRELLV